MPTYEFKNTDTDEVFEKFMKYDEKVAYLKDNPHIITHYSKGPNVDFDGGKSVLSRAGDGWKEVQDRIKSGLPPRLRDNIKSK
tara:strand:+ start:2067 stop:2315 length:249 start_codon:yes stop_codon:yes gene_type:complete